MPRVRAEEAMMIRHSESVAALPAVTVRESDLLEAICVGLESGEWTQLRDGRVYGSGNARCAYGVMYAVIDRAGMYPGDGVRDPVVSAAIRGAAVLLGQPIEAANDAGVPFAEIAQALRQSREGVGRFGDS
jgi:hypothetical protein